MGLYVFEALARAYKLHIHDFFFLLSVHFGCLPPSPYQIAGYATVRESPPPTPSPWCPIYIILNNRNGSPTPCTEIIFIWRLFGARVDVNFNLIMHTKNLYFGTQISKKSPPWEGDTPSHTLPLGVQYIILHNTTTETVSPTKSYTFGLWS